jgi:hypothetical protein
MLLGGHTMNDETINITITRSAITGKYTLSASDGRGASGQMNIDDPRMPALDAVQEWYRGVCQRVFQAEQA